MRVAALQHDIVWEEPEANFENQAWVVGVNRVGEGGRTTKLGYSGDSRIVDPLGETRAAAAGGEALLVTDADAAYVAEVRERFPFLPDRRA